MVGEQALMWALESPRINEGATKKYKFRYNIKDES